MSGARHAALAVVAVAAAAGLSLSEGGTAPDPNKSMEKMGYDDWFTDQAIRVDLFHTGSGKDWTYSLDEIVLEGVWPGTRRHLIDPFGYGTHRLRVTDMETGTEIFSEGYATLFDEWKGTEEALSGVWRTMSESVRFPCPRRPAVIHIDRRSIGSAYVEVLTLAVDPASRFVSRTASFADLETLDLAGSRPPESAMDLVIVPEGYTRADLPKLRADLERFTITFLDTEPWKSNRDRIRVRSVLAFSRESGPTEPRKGIFRDTILGSSFNTFDSPRYLTLMHTKTLRQVAARVPYDAILVLVNSGRYGGGGVYNQWAVFVSDNEYDEYVMLHEFGHSVGGLADEYYSSAISTDEDIMYPPGIEPWEPNITAFLGRKKEGIKWHDLIEPGVPLPTPERDEWAGKVGLFEGAGYKAKGLYRSEIDCKMFHKGLVGFCTACRRGLESMIDYYTGEDIGS